MQRHHPADRRQPESGGEHAATLARQFYFFTVGSLKQLDHIKRMVLALPKSATCLVLQTSPGDVRAIKHFTDFTLATVGSLDDLPLIMEVLA